MLVIVIIITNIIIVHPMNRGLLLVSLRKFANKKTLVVFAKESRMTDNVVFFKQFAWQLFLKFCNQNLTLYLLECLSNRYLSFV